jgi:ribose/xylose/arabinose/galactoside ABC-type transport system permease subunit
MAEVRGQTQAGHDFGENAVRVVLAGAQPDVVGIEGPRHPFLRRWLGSRNVTIAIAGILLCVLFSLTTDSFLTEFNLVNMVRSVALIGTVAVGMTLLFVVGEIDLSVGSVFGFLTIVFGVLVVRDGVDPWLTSALVILLGIGTGLLNGLIRTLLNIPSFIVTLAMLTAYRSLALIVSNERPMSVDAAGAFYWVTGGSIFHIPCLILWMLVVTLLGGIVLLKTRFGYHAYATGGNPEAARDAGIDIMRVKLVAFAGIGGLCGLAAALLFGYLHVAEPTTGTGFEFRVIGAVVVGGAALTGGRGDVVGTLIGTLIIAVITGGMVLMGFSQGAADIAAGGLIIAAGTIDLLLQRTAHG